LDDASFQDGVLQTLSPYNHARKSWGERQPIAFWRGGCNPAFSIRSKVADMFYNAPNMDIKLVEYKDAYRLDRSRFSEYAPISVHFNYKYICIIDGNVIASNHQWVFGSGAVPILITHPDNVYWFQPYLKPMVNYVPVKYDLSDFQEKVDWLVTNDALAKDIMIEAMKLASEVFDPQFQKQHLVAEIERIVKESSH
jgi:hypothetical protein